MSLKILEPGVQPLGQFDGVDTSVLTFKGGEIATLISERVGNVWDKASADAQDGYINPSRRPMATGSVATTARPLMLVDDGITGYGTLFGTVVGGTVGQTVYGPTSTVASANLLGPHTSTGSGKVTLWNQPGTYAVSLDACDTTVADGLTLSNTTLDTGASLTFVPLNAGGGLLTPVGSTAAAGNTVVVGRFIEFSTNGSIVNTPNKLASALGAANPRFAVFYFNPPVA